MRLLSLQVALFVDGIIERPDLLMPQINAEFNNMFNDMPNVIKLPPEAPAEIPIVQMFSIDQKYSLQGTTQGRYLTGGVPPVRFSM